MGLSWTRLRARARSSLPPSKLDVVRGGSKSTPTMSMLRSNAGNIPQDPGQAGKFQAAYLAGQLRGYSVSSEREEGNKERRADPFAAQCEHGFVKLVAGDWNQAFVDELCAFPNGAHDDQVDAASAAFRALMRRVTWHAA
jgi:predicted phage terminase large subunit-like protein